MKFGKHFAFLISLISVVALFSSCPSSDGGEYKVVNDDVVILFTNNMECSLINADTKETKKSSDNETMDVYIKSLGYSKIKALKDYARMTTGSNVVLVDSGNFVYGSGNENIIGQFTNGDEIIKIMNKVGYDLVCLGEKDTNYGAEKLKDYMNNANFKFLCANLKRKDGSRSNLLSKIETGYVVRDFGKTKVAFIGLTAPATANAGYLDDWEVVQSADENELASLVNQIAAKFDQDYFNYSGLKYKVLITNIGGTAAVALGNQLNNIDFIIDGGSRDGATVSDNILRNISTVRNMYYGHCGRYGEKVGVFRISGGKVTIDYMEDGNILNKDEVLADYIIDEKSTIDSSLSEKIATTSVPISRFGAPLKLNDPNDETSIPWLGINYKNALNYESFSGDLVADAFRKKAGSRIAVVTAGTLGKKTIAGPNVTLKDCYNFLDHSNSIGVVQVTGKQLKEVFENSVKALNSVNGGDYIPYTKVTNDKVNYNCSNPDFNGFLQVSGAIVRVDLSPTINVGQRVQEIWVLKTSANEDDPSDLSKYDKIDLSDNKTKYSLASTSYILSGCKEDYDVFNGLEVNYTDGANGDLTEGEALADYLKVKKTISSDSIKTGRLVFSTAQLNNSTT